jgi:SAM-dependent methyltransferase
MVQDQRILWDDKHTTGVHAVHSNSASAFAKRVLPELTQHTTLLDLGCGVGSDARYFARHGIQVTATDFSEVVIAQNQTLPKTQNLEFAIIDITDVLPYADNSFDVVYAHLSLHYFSNQQTQSIFDEISRVLRPSGKLYFACKSIHDQKYGEGEEIGPDMFIRKGHVRHFFSLGYCRQLLDKDFTIELLEETGHEYDGELSSFTYCFAAKRYRA